MKMPTIFQSSGYHGMTPHLVSEIKLLTSGSYRLRMFMLGVSASLIVLSPLLLGTGARSALLLGLYAAAVLSILAIAFQRLTHMTHRLHSLETQVRFLETSARRSRRSWTPSQAVQLHLEPIDDKVIRAPMSVRPTSGARRAS